MKAVILAAGRGSRMGDATENLPKCLTSLLGRTLLDWQLESLHFSGVKDIALVTGYRRDALESFVDTTFHNERWSETNMVMSLACADDWLSAEPTLVAYSDIVYRPDHVTALNQASDPICMTYDREWRSLWSMRFSDPLEDAESFRVDTDQRILEIGGTVRNIYEIEGQYMGLLKFTPVGWEQVKLFLEELTPPQRDKLDMTGLLSALIERGVVIRGVPVDGGWCEVDSQDDAQCYEKRIVQAETWSHDWRAL